MQEVQNNVGKRKRGSVAAQHEAKLHEALARNNGAAPSEADCKTLCEELAVDEQEVRHWFQQRQRQRMDPQQQAPGASGPVSSQQPQASLDVIDLTATTPSIKVAAEPSSKSAGAAAGGGDGMVVDMHQDLQQQGSSRAPATASGPTAAATTTAVTPQQQQRPEASSSSQKEQAQGEAGQAVSAPPLAPGERPRLLAELRQQLDDLRAALGQELLLPSPLTQRLEELEAGGGGGAAGQEDKAAKPEEVCVCACVCVCVGL